VWCRTNSLLAACLFVRRHAKGNFKGGFMSFADLTFSDHSSAPAIGRRVRVFAPNTLDLNQFALSIDEIELDPSTAMIFEDEKGIVVGWMWPGERLNDIELARLKATRAYVVGLSRRTSAAAA
jgi:hypothetical protein